MNKIKITLILALVSFHVGGGTEKEVVGGGARPNRCFSLAKAVRRV
jgi:hypothetical protein